MPPSTTSALHPIVIAPVQLPPHFTTLGTGLLHASHARESTATLRALLLSTPPLLENKSKPKPWWRAQCLLYGIDAPEKRTVQELRSLLELALLKRELEVPVALLEMEHKENGKFRKLNAQVREATGMGAEGKKKAAPKAAGDGGKGKKAATKDPLKAVKDATKITKPQPRKPAVKKDPVTVNVTINLSAPAKTKATGRKAKTETAKAPPKPRAKKAGQKVGVSDPTYFGLAIAQPEPPKVKSAPKLKRGGGAPKFGSRPVPVKKDPDVPRKKQMARCSNPGGPGGARVKEEPVWPKQEMNYDSDHGEYSDQYNYGEDEYYGYVDSY